MSLMEMGRNCVSISKFGQITEELCGGGILRAHHVVAVRAIGFCRQGKEPSQQARQPTSVATSAT